MITTCSRFEGSLTARDCKRHIPFRFSVPAHCLRLEIEFAFQPEQVQGFTNLITLTLFDPDGFRGAGHRGGARHRVELGPGDATAGYLPGPLPAGEWIVQIDTHMIMPSEPLSYRLEITATEAQEPVGPWLASAPPVPTAEAGAGSPGEGWYRGDLHCHTRHSDGAASFSTAELVATARKIGLDFVFLTDHNTTSGLPEMAALSTPELLATGGIEMTTFWGHALCLGRHDWADWRVRPGTGDMARIAAATYARDDVFIIAHPQATGDPGCTGCAWRFGDMMPGNARLVEIWNGPWDCDSNNEDGLSLWYDWLNQGLHLVATAGTDYHGTTEEAAAIAGISASEGATEAEAAAAANVGFSVIWAEALTERALLSALLAGHIYLSAGPRVDLVVEDGSGGRWMMGDTLAPRDAGEAATLTVTWEGCRAGAQVRAIVNGRLHSEWAAGNGGGRRELSITSAEADWVVVEIRDANGAMLAITNPIYMAAAP